MIYKLSVYSIQISILILETASNVVIPDHTVRIFNTETVVLSLGDLGDAKNDDLEIIKNPPVKSSLEKKMGKFHKYVNLVGTTENSDERMLFMDSNDLRNFEPKALSSYPEPDMLKMEEKHVKKTSRKRKRKKKMWDDRYQKRVKKSRNIRKREISARPVTRKSYDDDYQVEYMDFVKRSLKNGLAFKYSDEGKPEESFREIISKILDIKPPKNCSEIIGIGVQAVECIVINFRTGQLGQTEMIKAIAFIVLLWLIVYLAVALPLWCIKGWCCCCCCCFDFCYPNRTVREIQKYMIVNPPGVHVNSEGVEEHYNASQIEIELYEQLRRSLSEF